AGAACGPAAGVCSSALALAGGLHGSIAGAQAGADFFDNTLNRFFQSDESAGKASDGGSSPGKMQKEIERGQAPKSVNRVDKARAYGEQDNVHFKSGDALIETVPGNMVVVT
ncbi:MAG: hypothetical protein ACJ8BF_11430, partial [Gemmatimonadales bacterium]